MLNEVITQYSHLLPDGVVTKKSTFVKALHLMVAGTKQKANTLIAYVESCPFVEIARMGSKVTVLL